MQSIPFTSKTDHLLYFACADCYLLLFGFPFMHLQLGRVMAGIFCGGGRTIRVSSVCSFGWFLPQNVCICSCYPKMPPCVQVLLILLQHFTHTGIIDLHHSGVQIFYKHESKY